MIGSAIRLEIPRTAKGLHALGFANFPENAITIAANGLGDQKVLIRVGASFKPSAYLWLHETGKLEEPASSFHAIKMVNETWF